jgi:eukaryotic-like serine/threonine-protein kinase
MKSAEKIGRYEVKSKLGAGGMGEVFLARDTSLDRDVAIKVLLPEFCCNLERVNRFKLEARAASALNHPNIITIYEIGEDGDKLFISTEFIKGETLRSLIERKALDLSSALNIAEQIASATATAHAAGIIHRDIKPENIMAREDGIVKVLDFGLAKPTAVESEAETRELVSTKAGMVMGSVGYMSPEQSRGKEVDARTDLWSIGVVLYEMLTGKTPFDDETMTDILANIIHKDPIPVSEKVENCPHELSRIVKKSLKKDREERYQTAKDFLLDIKNLRREMELEHELEVSVSPSRFNEIRNRSNELTQKSFGQKVTNENANTQIFANANTTQISQAIESQPKPKKRTSMVLFAVLGLFLLGGLWALSYATWQKPRLANSFANVSVEKMPIKKTVFGVEFSPDSKFLAYVEGSQGSKTRLILRNYENGSEKDIVPFEDSTISLIGFSPDSNYIYFRKGEKAGIGAALFRVPILGGEPKQIAFDVDSGGSFSPDGKQIVFHRHTITPPKDEIFTINADGTGKENLIYSNTENQMHPQWSPDGKIIILSTFDKTKGQGVAALRLGYITLENGKFTPLGNNYFDGISDYRWLKDGSGLLVSGVLAKESNNRLFTVRFPDGKVENITKDANDYYGNSITADGKTIATIQATTISGIWEFDLATKNAKQISPTNEERKGYSSLNATPDGRLLFSKFDGKDNVDVWQMNADGTNEKVLLGGNGENRVRFISNDGNFIVFESVRNGSQEFWKMNADGSNQVQITNSPEFLKTFAGVTPDNKSLIYKNQDLNGSQTSLVKLNLETNETITIWQDDKTFLQNAILSPDGKQIIYAAAPIAFENGVISQASLFIANFDGTKMSDVKTLQKVAGVRLIRFSNDGKSLFYIEVENDGADIWRMNISDGKTTKVTNFNLESIFRFTISPDGKKAYFVRGNNTREVVLIKNGLK